MCLIHVHSRKGGSTSVILKKCLKKGEYQRFLKKVQ